MRARPIGLAIAGCGRFGNILAAAVSGLDDFRLVLAVDADPTAAATTADRWGASSTASFEDALVHPEVDAVLLATNHASHKDLTVAAARAGKHVFCEKPMAITYDECQAMIAAASRARVQLMVGHLYRLLPLVRQAGDILAGGSLGSAVAIQTSRSSRVSRHGWWSRRSTYGGLLHSPGIHNLDLMNHFLGRPVSVFALSPPSIQDGIDYPDTMFVTVAYEGSRVGSLYASMSDSMSPPDGTDRFRILCEKGSLEIDFIPPGRLVTCVDGIESSSTGLPGDVLRAGANQAIRDELMSFAAAVRGEAEPFMDAQDAAIAVAVCEAAYASAERRLPVTVAR